MVHRLSSRSGLLPLALALLLPACSDAESPSPLADPCEAMASTCLADQQACVADAQGAHCAPCGAGEFATTKAVCAPIGGTVTAHEFDPFTLAAGQEILGKCVSWTLDNPEELWVTAVELNQDIAFHHSNWTFVPDNLYVGPDGLWTCKDRNYSQLDAVLAGGILYIQSTQTRHEVQRFPDGAAIRIPPYSRVMGDIHLLNTSPDEISGHAGLGIHAVPVDEVKVKLTPFHLGYHGLDLPPHATSRFVGDCKVGKEFPGAAGVPFGMKVYYLAPHAHSLVTRFFVNTLGGPNDGKSLFEYDGYNEASHGVAYDPPIDMKGAEGFSFGCQYENPRSVEVKWGFGDQEMCDYLGYADSRVAFESDVADVKAAGTDGEVQVFNSECKTAAFAWDNTKPGGPGPK